MSSLQKRKCKGPGSVWKHGSPTSGSSLALPMRGLISTAFLEGRSVICIKMKCADTLVIPLDYWLLEASQLCKG